MVKAQIQVYLDRAFTTPVGDPLSLPVNPESYSKNFRVEYESSQPPGTQGAAGRYKVTAPKQLRLEFIMDGTNTIQGYEYNGFAKEPTEKEATVVRKDVPQEDLVNKQLDLFLNTVYDMSSDTHRPNFLKVVWGEHLFQGILGNLDINYSLFHPNGKPLRVKINATFEEYVAPEQRQQRANLRSPDLTRIRRFKEGDRLDKIVYEFYNDPKFIAQVARANGLTSFRLV